MVGLKAGGFQSEAPRLGTGGCIPAAHPPLPELLWGHCAVGAIPPSHQVLVKVGLLPLRSAGAEGQDATLALGTAAFQPVASRVVLGLSLEMDVVTPDNNIHFPGFRSWILVFHAILVFISVFIILRFMRF